MAQWILPTDDRWKSILAEAEYDFYHLPCYAELASILDHGEPRAFYTELPTGKLLIPLLVRNIPVYIYPDTGFLDATSPYGYPSPLFSNDISICDALKGIRDFIEFGRETGLVTTFLRLHPILNSTLWQALSSDYRFIDLVNHGSTVSIDLTLDTEELNRRLRRNHKNNIKRLYKMGFSVRIDHWEDYPDFINIYYQTMHRCDATAYYFFDRDYFTRLRKCLGTKLHLCSVISPDGDMASGGLDVHIGKIMQAHLNATADKYLSMAPSKLTFYEMRNWAKAQGAKIFHLGGGVGGARDSLFFYKQGLGTHEHQFTTLGIIHDLSAYEKINENWIHTHTTPSRVDSEFFPFYRNLAIDAW